jgi:hypothetical protein
MLIAIGAWFADLAFVIAGALFIMLGTGLAVFSR